MLCPYSEQKESHPRDPQGDSVQSHSKARMLRRRFPEALRRPGTQRADAKGTLRLVRSALLRPAGLMKTPFIAVSLGDVSVPRRGAGSTQVLRIPRKGCGASSNSRDVDARAIRYRKPTWLFGGRKWLV